jgi:DNA-binding Xre family transcriptional regulator
VIANGGRRQGPHALRSSLASYLVNSASITKLGKNENVNTEILAKICKALNCDIADIMEMSDDMKR